MSAQTFVFGPGSASVGANSGSGTVGLTVFPAGSAWSATSNAAWLTVSPPSGNGSAILTYNYSSNLGTVDSRIGTITVGTQTFNVTQAGAAMSLSATSASVDGSGGSGTFNITTGAGVTWSSSSNVGWLSATPGGIGNATVTYNYADVPLTIGRVGVITIGSQTFTVTQAGAVITFSPPAITLPAGAGSQNVQLNIVPNTASWDAYHLNGNWFNFSPRNGTGNTQLALTVTANPTTIQRRDTIVAGALGNGFTTAQSIVITQEGRKVALSKYSVVVGADAGSGSFSFTVDPPDIPFTVSTVQTPDSNGDWLSVTPTNGTGGATITYSYSINLSTRGRMATIVVGSRKFAVSQRSAGGDYTAWGPTSATQTISLPGGKAAVAVDGKGDVYLLPNGYGYLGRISASTGSGTSLRQLDGGESGLAADVTGRYIYIAQPNQCLVSRLDTTHLVGNSLDYIIGTGCAFPGLNAPRTVALDPAGNVYIVDTGNKRVRRFDIGTFELTTVAGNGVEGTTPDGALATAGPIVARGIALDSSGNLYLSEGSRVRRVDAITGLLSTVAGKPNSEWFFGDDGLATEALLNNPTSIAIDNADNLYIVDANNYRIRRVDAVNHIITTLIGNGTASNSGDGGPAHLATIFHPDTVTVDNAGNVYFSDPNISNARFIDYTTPRPPLTITADSASRTYGTVDPVFTGTIGSTIDGDVITATYSSSASVASPVGAYDIIPVPQGALVSKYDITLVKGTLTINSVPLGVSANSFSRTYGAANPTLTGNVSGIQNGDPITFSYSTIANSASQVGVYPIVPIVAGAQLSNYTVTTNNGSLTIDPAPLSVTANSFIRNFGEQNPNLTGTLGQTQNGDVIGVTYSTTATAMSLPGTYSIVPTLSGAKLPNYAVNATNGTLTIRDIVFFLWRPYKPSRIPGAGPSQSITFQVGALAPGEVIAVSCFATGSLTCSAPKEVMAAGSAATFEVTVRSARSQRLQRGGSGTLRVQIQAGTLTKELSLNVAF